MSEAAKVDLVGVGLNATDTLIAVPRHPERGSKVESLEVSVLPGGQVASAVIACQSWGLQTRYVGKLGDDPAATLHRQEFAKAGVETQIITAQRCASQQAFILVDPDGERTVLWRRDENLGLHSQEVKREWIVNARALLVDGYDTAAARTAAGWAREAGIPVIADFDDAYPGIEKLIERLPNAKRLREHLMAAHTLPEDVGRIAAQAAVKTLVLSHFVPGDDPSITDEQWSEGVRKYFKGRIIVGKDLMEI